METRTSVGKVGESCNEDIDCAIDSDCIDGTCQTTGAYTTGSTLEKIFWGPYYEQTRTTGKKRKRRNSQKKETEIYPS
jgi:hypothetical protein